MWRVTVCGYIWAGERSVWSFAVMWWEALEELNVAWGKDGMVGVAICVIWRVLYW